ncbi:hypothetical protein [Methylocystis sp. ATCC 49242]|uniref:hypothetical protein n=1 Tax=Methylocystis sp. ATCC 49242 TaxID=622637 RepID=UPI001185B318|nr:hypothetical protein [Methylocystis sp. ATCC 49242]
MNCILGQIEIAQKTHGCVFFPAAQLAAECYGFQLFERPPTRAETNSVLRAMHAICRKSNQYALAGGKGRTPLHLYDASCPVSSALKRLRLDEKPERINPSRAMQLNSKGKSVPARRQACINDAKRAVAAVDPEYKIQFEKEQREALVAQLSSAGIPKAKISAVLALFASPAHDEQGDPLACQVE